ncbi:MAG TPA: dihydropteroate synthase [Xanthobacteraceae bacterium]|nr:dihydropteroate synthase [Xanthobacteraceae bacterium]
MSMLGTPKGAKSAGDQRAESPPSAWFARLLAARKPAVMGILNVTPDSFSDGGRFFDPAAAIDHARAMIAEGADILDIGAESTRPYGGQRPVDAREERRRLEPVLSAVCALGVPVSIDTMKAEVARWALAQGARMANDVWGLQRDPAMAAVVAEHGCPVIVMHNRDTADPALDIMAEMERYFARSLEIAARAGIVRERIVLDPGIGFGKVADQSIEAIARLGRLRAFGLPLLLGASRKRFIDGISPAPPDQRLGGSIAAHVIGVLNGAAIIRAHDVAETVQALKVAAAIQGRAKAPS